LGIPPLIWQNALITFALSIILGTIIGFIAFLPFFLTLLFLLMMIAVGVVFDIVGIAVAASEERPLHAMGADRVVGSGQAIWLVRRADRVANFCNDVIGDVSGTISGAITVIISTALAVRLGLERSLLSVLAIALTAALTVAGKAFGKAYALRSPHTVVLTVGRFLSKIGWPRAGQRRGSGRGRSRKGQGRG